MLTRRGAISGYPHREGPLGDQPDNGEMSDSTAGKDRPVYEKWDRRISCLDLICPPQASTQYLPPLSVPFAGRSRARPYHGIGQTVDDDEIGQA